MTIIEVAAGLVFRNRKLLIIQRPVEAHLGGLWEFPGGKREANETFVGCLRRELWEELAIEVEIGEVVESITHAYPEKTVYLQFYRCQWRAYEPQAIGCPAWAWVPCDELAKYQFPAADARLIKKIQRSPELWGGS